MSSNSLIIKFTPAEVNLSFEPKDYAPPSPAINKLPEWYRKLSRFQTSNDLSKLFPVNDRGTDGSAGSTKLCMPFLDSLSAGYMFCLEDDIEVTLDKSGFPSIKNTNSFMLVDKRNMVEVAVPHEHHPMHYGWKIPWHCETPPGYSILITHPHNRHDLPFTTLSGIIDSDDWNAPVFTAFFLKRNFMGTIKKGTPIFQVFPFKRENWEMSLDYSKEDIVQKKIKEEKRRISIYSYYKDFVWKRKNYTRKEE